MQLALRVRVAPRGVGGMSVAILPVAAVGEEARSGGQRVEVVDKNTGQNPCKPGDLVALQFFPEDCIVMEDG